MANTTSIFDITGSATHKTGTTIQTFAISLAAGFVLFAVQFSIFLIIRNYLWAKRIYQPRSFLIPLKNRIKPPANNPFKWLWTVFKIPEDPEVLQKAGMDAYFFLRYLSMCLKIFFPMAVVILPILIPLNVVDGKNTKTFGGTRYNVTGLDTCAWSNVSPEHTSRYWAHLVLAVGVVIWVCFLCHEELMHFVLKRQEYLGSPRHRLKASSTTVLITGIPDDICNTEALTELYGDFPGGIRRIWINRELEAMVAKDVLRKKYEDMLENAETNLIRSAVRKSHKGKTRQTVSSQSGGLDAHAVTSEVRTSEKGSMSNKGIREDGSATPAACARDLQHDVDTVAAWTGYLAPKQRKTMRIAKSSHTTLFKIPLIGRLFSDSVDTIYFCRRELARLNKEMRIDVEAADSCPHNRSAFVQFNSQKAAHLACQSVADTRPKRMTQRMVEISPADINWSSLGLSWRGRYLRLLGYVTLYVVLIFLYGLVSVFTGILSRASTLGAATSWLDWITKLPNWLLSFIQGTLPPVILVLILSGPLPILLRTLANSTRGATTGSEGERSLQLAYFCFLLIELFIIPTISSGLTSTVQSIINNPGNIPTILATDLPTAANYYFSFLIVEALSISASSILQTVRLLNYYVLGSANTPDAVFDKLSWTNRTRIGSNIPWYTTFAVIGLVYSVIAPLMLIFMLITFGLFWIVIKNNLLYVVRTGNVDGGGLFFPNAINQLFTGLYFMEICLVGLFFLVRNVDGMVACKAQGIIMVIVLVLTALYQIWLANNFAGLYTYAPVRLDSDAARREKDWVMEPLTSVPQTAARPRLEDIVGNNRPAFVTALSSQHDLASMDGDTISTPVAAPVSPPRSKDLLAQHRADEKSAQRILARLNQPLDETRLAALETHLVEMEQRVGNALVPRRADVERQMMNDPISKIIMQHHDELEDLDPEERDLLISVAFTHPVLRETAPSVWIPGDELGVSDDEVERMRALDRDLIVSNRGAHLDKKLKVVVSMPPPDMSEFALVLAEL